MSPNEHDVDDEIRGHLAIEIQRRIQRGEDPETARQAALRDFGNVTLARESIRGVWRPRGFEALAALWHDLRIAGRSLGRTKGLALTVVATLALAIGANAAIFSVVRGVLLRPLVNRDEDRLIYIRQSATGLSAGENMTFSIPEIRDLESRVTTVAAFGDFSTVDLALLGLGDEPRMVKAGVVNGSFFDVMGLQPVLGRLIAPQDDRRDAPGVAVLTYRFWATAFNRDRTVVGRRIRLGVGPATIVGVLEPSVPYPADTEVIANIVTSPHHLGATMTTSRTHRMTELFGRLAPGASMDSARADLQTVYSAMVHAHPEAYPTQARFVIRAAKLRDQITAPARTILLLLLGSAAIVFVIACSNVANLILARSVRRENELAVRAALGAGPRALRRTLLAESLVLCGAGAVLGVLLARPFVVVVARYASHFTVRALDVTVDSGVLWVGASLALGAAILLAYVPRLPAPHAPAGLGLVSGLRITPGTNRRLRLFAVTQIALSFVLLAGAAMLLTTLLSLQTAATGYDTRHVLAFNLPTPALGAGVGEKKTLVFYDEVLRRTAQLPGVETVAAGSFVPWRDAGTWGPPQVFGAEGYAPATGEEAPRARFRVVSPNFFAAVGLPVLAGRDFRDEDGLSKTDPVAVVSLSIAQRFFPGADAVNRHIWWGRSPGSADWLRIVGVVGDADDENLSRGPAMSIYEPFHWVIVAGRLFVKTAGDPYSLVPAVTRVVRQVAPDQPVEQAATLEDVRSDALAADRLNAFVISGFAGIALLVAAIGVAGVLAFSVSARTRELGIRLAIGLAPRHILGLVLSDGLVIAAAGVVTGAIAGWVLARTAAWFFGPPQLPSLTVALGAAALLVGAAIVASLVPAARASRVDVLQALRAE